jgi:hypothetical protein
LSSETCDVTSELSLFLISNEKLQRSMKKNRQDTFHPSFQENHKSYKYTTEEMYD